MFGSFQWSAALVQSALGQTKLFESSLLLWFFLSFFFPLQLSRQTRSLIQEFHKSPIRT
jgi:hypothetical protein